MKIKKNFVRGFLVVALIVLILNIVLIIFNRYNTWAGIGFVFCIMILLFMFLRRRIDEKKILKVFIAIAIVIIFSGVLIQAHLKEQLEQSNSEKQDGKLNGYLILDVGSEFEDSEVFSKLRPRERVSERKAIYDSYNQLVTFRELKNPYVYTDLTIPLNCTGFNLIVKFKENFPDEKNAEKTFYIGLQDKKDGHHRFYKLFDKNLDLSGCDFVEENNIYLCHKNKSAPRFDNVTSFLKNLPDNRIIGYDGVIIPNKENSNLVCETGEFYINGTLRGSHSFYIYAKGNLEVKFIKKDRNYYDGKDVFNISLSKFDGLILKTKLVNDDGITDKQGVSREQNISFNITNLKEGVYKLYIHYVGEGEDSTIKNLWINQKKVVFDKYAHPLSGFSFYSKRNSFRFKTYHEVNFQNITINKELVKINKTYVDHTYESNFEIKGIVPKGDIMIKSNEVFSISKKNYFEPYKYDLVDTSGIGIYMAEYVVLNYRWVRKDGWIISSVEVPISGLYFKDTLSVILNAPHLKSYSDYTVPVDFIGVKFYENSQRRVKKAKT